MDTGQSLTQAPIPKLIRKIALPASIGFFFNTMYNVVDTYFGGLISTQVVAALSLSFPVFFVIIALGSGMATGATALIATATGEDNSHAARVFAVQSVTCGILLSAMLTPVGMLISPFLFSLLGASERYLEICLSYMNVIFWGAVFFMQTYMLNAILNAHGNTKPYRNFLIFGFCMNVVLDPWFIYGGLGVPPMGTAGIALATVVVQGMGCIYLGAKVLESGFLGGMTWREFLPDRKALREIIRQGLPASSNTLTVGIGIFIITWFISKFGKEAVAAYGIATRIEQIALLPTIGLNIATLTIVAQNNGARRNDRIHETIKTALQYGAVLMLVGGVCVFTFSGKLMDFFTSDPMVRQMGQSYLRVASFVLYAYSVLYIHVAALQGIKRPMFAIWIGLYRQIAAPCIVFYIMIYWFDSGILGIWWGIFAVTWSATAVTYFYAHKIIRNNSGISLDQPV